ncbi:ABC transporter ATP-binding protein [Leifsonia sp. H3M29-4]|uniref:ABC transporter ATP-binding protein n=1 Tax=Salinibacterium metalliresistens TaxID=3031321 RepID=UPI0023DCAABE|nr:ABC transporter ATP-binding protein [Salinibacterium metalliresistens]MDF1479686.1 ABC transporter ATP-binding protein [Salinibacterium metalliresistens]
MTAIIEVDAVTKVFGKVTAVDDVTLSVEEHGITGLLGRNGAGKTTLMQLITGQDFVTRGDIRVFGESPVENASVLQRISFIKESQRYPDDFKVKHVFRSAPWFFANWDEDFAERLIQDFRLPLDRRIKKLSRGQLSAIGVIVGLASRAPLTFFDEPYLGLDAVARQTFYDRLLEDYAHHPRTVILSTHLIDEVSNLLEHVIVIDQGRIIIDQDAESLRGSATTVVGTGKAVDAFIGSRTVLHRDGIGGLASVTVAGLSAAERTAAKSAGLELAPVSLQQLVIQKTNASEREFAAHDHRDH